MSEFNARDAVDQIVAEWTNVRGDLDFSPLEVFSRIKRISRQLDSVRRSAFSAAQLELWEFDVLSALRRAGHPHALTPKQLMQTNLVSSGTMTNRIDRLEARGLVHRSDDPADGRSVLVHMTGDGIERVDEAIKQLLRAEQALLEPLSAPDRDLLAGMLRALARRMSPNDN
ncbi:MarR family transcriptional regulator [uncultured Gulosibacter sp.]|uniref:MarR family winged helix-turn-helix transcriptional regulator n=1 Tax=uncultured Gulosibacter sp. TaxID=1339167 RepID=UPI00288BAC83|nr:MarR family transcriptional regulator [uncultured Gulosibacter sp.]